MTEKKKPDPDKPADLYYVGGEAYLPGIPATDLTAGEIEARGLTHARLLKSGLYSESKPTQPAKEDEPAEGKE